MEDELERGLLLPQGGGGVPEYHRLSSDVIERTTVLIRPSRRHASARPRTARGVGRVSAGDPSLSLSLSLSLSDLYHRAVAGCRRRRRRCRVHDGTSFFEPCSERGRRDW